MTRIAIQLTITVESALSIGAGGSAGTLADKSIVRDGWGRPLIPGSHVKGKLRWLVEQLLRSVGQEIPTPFDAAIDQTHTAVRALFGSPEHRSPLRFADLATSIVAAEQAPAMSRNLSQIRPSVSINRRRGVAEDARLLFQEITLEHMQFSHNQAIIGELSQEYALQHAALLWAALKLTDRWGGAKSRGLGWVRVDAAVTLGNISPSDMELADALRVALATGGKPA